MYSRSQHYNEQYLPMHREPEPMELYRTASEEQYRERLLLNYYARARKLFAAAVYILALLFIIVALVIWFCMYYIPSIGEYIADRYYICLVCVGMVLMLLTIFIFCSNLRIIHFLGLIFALIIVGGSAFALPFGILFKRDVLFYGCLAGALVIIIIFSMIGGGIPCDLTLHVVAVFLISIVFFIISMLFLALDLLAGVPYSNYLFLSFVAISVIMFIMYHAQTIVGERFAEMRAKDYILGALIVFFDYLIVLLVLMFFVMAYTGRKPQLLNSRSATTAKP